MRIVSFATTIRVSQIRASTLAKIDYYQFSTSAKDLRQKFDQLPDV
jgi:hypothetical protein